MPETVEGLEAAVRKMRELGVTEWNGIKLGPAPTAPGSDDEEEPSDTKAKDLRTTRERVGSLASGGPVKLGGRPQQPTR